MNKFLIFFITLFFISCGNDNKKENNGSPNTIPSSGNNVSSEKNPVPYQRHNQNTDSRNDCGYLDGNYSAEVDYTNSQTGYSQTYTLDVQVEDCSVIEIDFPKGGWLDGTHINPTEIDEDGNASIEDDRGRSFDVHLSESDKRNDQDGADENKSNEDE